MGGGSPVIWQCLHSSLPYSVVVGIAIKSSQCSLVVGCLARPHLAVQFLEKASNSVISFPVCCSFQAALQQEGPCDSIVSGGGAPLVPQAHACEHMSSEVETSGQLGGSACYIIFVNRPNERSMIVVYCDDH